MSSLAKWPCPACGHKTIAALPPGPPGTWVVCPVCFWEDAPPGTAEEEQTRLSANVVSLPVAQRKVLKIGAIDECYLDRVRAPLPDEARADDWQTLDAPAAEERAALIAEIEAAFDGVSREGGVSLHETEPIDRYGSSEECQAARALDTESRWQDVPHADLAEVCDIGGISFFDPIGWRYYLPAYMTWWLSGGESSGSFAAECLIYSLNPSAKLRDHYLDRYAGLSEPQAVAVTRFLRFVDRFGESEFLSQQARAGLAKYWTERCR